VERDLVINHILLAATNPDHIGLDGVGQYRTVILNEGHLCTRVRSWMETGDRWHQPLTQALHHGNLSLTNGQGAMRAAFHPPAAYDDGIEGSAFEMNDPAGVGLMACCRP
jgi:hypothetical protein